MNNHDFIGFVPYPHMESFKREGEKYSMKYHNAYGGDCWLLVTYNPAKKSYKGEKFVNGKTALNIKMPCNIAGHLCLLPSKTDSQERAFHNRAESRGKIVGAVCPAAEYFKSAAGLCRCFQANLALIKIKRL